jgi:uncharacterized membrane protein (DUF485 family)
MHENINNSVEESDELIAYKTKLGLKMFLVYSLFYIGFVAINTLNPKLMGISIFGLNLAILYGFFLILSALVMAIIYNQQCLIAEDTLSTLSKKEN